jgi:transposase
MSAPQKNPLRALTASEQQQLERIVKASSERIDVVRRAKALLALTQGQALTEAGKLAGISRQAVAQLVERFHQRGMAAVLTIAPGRGRKLTYDQEVRAHILRTVQRPPDRQVDGTATWSLKTLERTIRRELGLPKLCAHTIHRVLVEAGYTSQQSRTWCPTGTAERVRKEGVVVVHDPQTQEKKVLIEQAYQDGESAGVMVLCQDEAGPYQAIPQPGASWQPEGKAALQPHEYVRGGTAKLLTLFRPATGEVRAKGVLSAPNAVLHPWLKDQLSEVLAEIEKKQPSEQFPPESERPLAAQWRSWLQPHESASGLPPLRILLVWDNLAGHLTPDLVIWLFHHGVMPLYTPLSGSWLNMAESVQRIIVHHALSGQHPKTAEEVIDWLEQTVTGWNAHPTPFVWKGKRYQRRKRTHLRRLGGSGAALLAA